MHSLKKFTRVIFEQFFFFRKSTVQKGLSQTTKSQLSEVAVISKRLHENRKRSNQSKPLGPTKPQDFNFATDARLGPKKMEPPQAPTSKKTRSSSESVSLSSL